MDNDVSNKRNKRTKKELYKEERERLITTLNGLMGMDEKNKRVYYVDIINNEELKKYLNENLKNIRIWYRSASWGYFSAHHHKREESDITTLIRPIYKNEDYEILSTSKTAIKNGIKKQYIELYFKKKD